MKIQNLVLLRQGWRIGALLLLVLGMTACQASPPSSPASSPSAVMPSPTLPLHPSPTTVPTKPSPQPSPTATTQPSPLPLLPPQADLPWNTPLPILSGAVDDPHALSLALQNTLGPLTKRAWIAAWPPEFPADFPLPSQGWLVLATQSNYPDTTQWTLYLDIPTDIAAWEADTANQFRSAHWEIQDNPGFTFQNGDYMAWCNADATQSVEIFSAELSSEHTIAQLFYNTASQSPAPGCISAPPFQFPPDAIPTFQNPPDVWALGGEQGGGDQFNWTITQSFHSAKGIQPLSTSFTQQLSDQGWEVQTTLTGNLDDSEASLVLAHNANSAWPHAAMLIVGHKPRYHLWLWIGVIPSQKKVYPDLENRPTLHGQTEDAMALRRALALAVWSAQPLAKPPHVWVAEAPDPWPIDILPHPPQAQWEDAKMITYPDGQTSWTLVFILPGTKDDVSQRMQALLTQAGWRPLQTVIPDITTGEAGFQPALFGDSFLNNTFCDQKGESDLGASYQTEGKNTRVFWSVTRQPGLCQRRAGPPNPIKEAGAPVVSLSLPPKSMPNLGGESPLEDDFTNGYTTQTLWWSDLSLKEQLASFAQQLEAKGWQTQTTTWDDQLGWIHGTMTDQHGITWQVDVLITPLAPHYFWGTLMVSKASP